jgi:hypothetical protein
MEGGMYDTLALPRECIDYYARAGPSVLGRFSEGELQEKEVGGKKFVGLRRLVSCGLVHTHMRGPEDIWARSG